MEKGECLLTELQFCFLIYILYKPLISLTTLFSSSHPGCWNPMESYRLKFQIVSGWLVEGDTLQEVWSDLHRDSRKLTLHGLRGRLPPPCLLCFCLAAAALEEVWMGEKGWPTAHLSRHLVHLVWRDCHATASKNYQKEKCTCKLASIAFGFKWKPAFIAYSQWPKLSRAILYACKEIILKNQDYIDYKMTKSNENRNLKFL